MKISLGRSSLYTVSTKSGPKTFVNNNFTALILPSWIWEGGREKGGQRVGEEKRRGKGMGGEEGKGKRERGSV